MGRRLLLAVVVASTLLNVTSANAQSGRARDPGRKSAIHRTSSAVQAQALRTGQTTTDPVALSLKLAERYWGGTPACGTPTVITSPKQLPDSAYERVTSPEPSGSVVEMWTEVQSCTITINAGLWKSWQEEDDSFQWFCDAMTHEVGHLFGHPDGGQTDPSSITYPYLSNRSPNFNSVPDCKSVTLRYGAQMIRDEQIIPAPTH